MESDLMREPWTFPREPACSVVVQPICATTAASSARTVVDEEPPTTDFSAWEENFQDLSDWCMASTQARCDFPAGESAMATKLTGKRIEGSDVLTAAKGATRGLMQTIGKKTFNGGDTIVGASRLEPATCVVPSQFDHAYPLAGPQQQQLYFNNNNSSINNNNNNSINAKTISSCEDNFRSSGNAWMGLPAKVKSTVPTGSSSIVWQELSDLGITAAPAGSTLYQQPDNMIEMKQEQEPVQPRNNQDVFRTLDTDPPNGFDLLSYLCEDDIPSPGDSVSTDSSQVTDINSQPRLPSNSSAHTVVSTKTYEPVSPSAITVVDPLRTRLQSADSPYSQESLKFSPISSTNSEIALATRTSQRQSLRTIIKVEEPESPPMERRATRLRRTRLSSSSSRTSTSTSSVRGKGRKRMFNDDENDDSGSDNEGYRETREKNNEASRKSRMNKKAKEQEMARRSVELEKDNRILKMKVEELEKLVTSMRNALLRSALKKEVKTTMF